MKLCTIFFQIDCPMIYDNTIHLQFKYSFPIYSKLNNDVHYS